MQLPPDKDTKQPIEATYDRSTDSHTGESQWLDVVSHPATELPPRVQCEAIPATSSPVTVSPLPEVVPEQGPGISTDTLRIILIILLTAAFLLGMQGTAGDHQAVRLDSATKVLGE